MNSHADNGLDIQRESGHKIMNFLMEYMKIGKSFHADNRKLPELFVSIALGGAVSSSLLSISASQILLFATIVGAICFRKRIGKLLAPPIVWPLALFAVWTVIVCLASEDSVRNLLQMRKLFLYAILLLVPYLLRNSGKQFFRIYASIFVASLISAMIGIVQFAANPKLDLLHRISGPMSHWMTYSGLLMLAFIGLCAYAVCCSGKIPRWVYLSGLFLIAGMYLSQTRSSWLGSVAGVTTVFLLRRPRAIFSMAVLLGLFYLASPEVMKLRLRSAWDHSNSENRSRIELLETSLKLIKNNPWLGVGPENVSQEALRYRGTHEFEDWLYQHMHNNALQIAVERGIPGLILWCWVMIRLEWDAFRVYRSTISIPSVYSSDNLKAALMVSTAALGAWIGLLAAGMFEYNFGDSEVLILYLFIAASPYAFYYSQTTQALEGKQNNG